MASHSEDEWLRNIIVEAVLSDVRGGLVSVHVRHVAVHENDMKVVHRACLLDPLYSLDSVEGLLDL